ncbi:DNA-directed RNA polymerase subunit omega [Boudabousia tangfeifanii]|uniref:DNA-directed RNA polymerase subunit omega n=1 Tax=Boudabousia tangfeifanii TaxID=1912795 RepID=A0A1D9MK19_9ACTO|nr:DNA-directed RNA polymerase subunit omega [Boudabousia tangfeifanii]AOZ72626.1 DNA-directed RNA polymerase subunit omega [Boudabousia tangfeifanii]
MTTGTVAQPEGITSPPIDDLLEQVDSKYALVVYSARRARQINTYLRQRAAGMIQGVPPLVETEVDDKPLSIAMHEIAGGKLNFYTETVDPQ